MLESQDGAPLGPRPGIVTASRIYRPVSYFKSRESGNAFPLQFIACEFRKQTRIYGRTPGRGPEGTGNCSSCYGDQLCAAYGSVHVH